MPRADWKHRAGTIRRPTFRARAALEASYIGSAPTHAAELARHYALSGNKQAALHWSLLAGEDAAHQQAHREAISHFRLVLNLLQAGIQTPQAQPIPSPAQLHISIGESWFKLGELEHALASFQQALQHPQSAPPLLLARANRLIADVYRMQSKYDLALAHLQAVRTIFATTTHTRSETHIAPTPQTHDTASTSRTPFPPG